MCRYTCGGCCWSNIHKVLGFELIDDERCEPFIRIEVSRPCARDGNFFCLGFKAIPVGLTSYPLVVHLNDEDIPIENRCGRAITSAEICPCQTLSGIFCGDKLVVCGV